MHAFRNMSKAIYLLSLVAAAAAVPYARSSSNIGADTGSVPSTVDSGESLSQEHNTLLNSTSSGGSGSKYTLNNVGGNDLSGLTIFSRVVLHESQLSIPAANIFPDSDNSSTSVSSMPDYPSYIPTEDDRVEEAVNKIISVNGHAITKRDISSTPNSSKDLTSTTKEVVYHSDKKEMFQSTEPQPAFLKKAESEVLSHSLPADSSYADAMYIKSIYSAFDLNSAAIGFPYAHDNLITRKKFSSEASKDYDKVTTVTNTERINSNETTESNPILSEIYNDSTFSDDMHLHSVSDETDCPEQLPQYSDTHPITHSNTDYRTSGSVAEEVHKDTVGIKILHPNSPDTGDSTSAKLDNIHGYLQNTSIAKNVSNNITIQSPRSTSSEINTDNFSLKALITMLSLFSGKHQISDDDSNQDSSDSHEVQLQTTRFMNNKTSWPAEVNSGKQTRSISIPDYAESNSTSQYESTESQSMESSSGDKTGQQIDNSASNSESKASHPIGTSSCDHEAEPLIDGNSSSQSESKSSQFIVSSSSGHETGQKIDSSIDSYSETTTSQSMETLSLCYESDKQIDSSVASHSESVESQSFATSYSHETSPQIDGICELYRETATSQLLGAFSSAQETGQNFDSSSASRSENMESQSMGRPSSGHETDRQIESNTASNSESVALQSTETSSSGQETIQKTDSISTSHFESMESQSMGRSHSGHENGKQINSNSTLHTKSVESQSSGTSYPGHETSQQIDSIISSYPETMTSQFLEVSSSGQESGQRVYSSSVSHSENMESPLMRIQPSGHESDQQIERNTASNSENATFQSMGISSFSEEIFQKIDSSSAMHSKNMESQSLGKFSSGYTVGQQIYSNSDLHSGSTESQSMKPFCSDHDMGQQTHSISASNSENLATKSFGISSSSHKTVQNIDSNSDSNSESMGSQSMGTSSSVHETGQPIDSNSKSHSESSLSQSMGSFFSVHETGQPIDSNSESHSESSLSQSMGTFSSGHETGQPIDSNSESHSESSLSQSMGTFSSGHETGQPIDSNSKSHSESSLSQSMGTFFSVHETGQPIDSNSESHSESSLSQSMGTFSSGHETGQPIDSNSESHSESPLSQSMGTFFSGHETGQPIDSNSESHSESPLSQSMGTFFSGHETGQPIDSNSESHSESPLSPSMGTFFSDHDIGQKIYSRSASNSESMASQPMEKFSSGHKTGQQTMSSFDDPDKTAWTRSRHDRTSYSGGVKSGLPKAQTLYSGSPIQEHLTDFIDRYIPLYFVTQASGYSENPLPKELSHSFRYSNAGSTGGQEFGLSDLPGYMTKTSSGQPYYINDGTAASLLIPGPDTRGNYVREEYQISDRRSPVSDLPLYDRQNGYKISSPSDSFSSELLDSSHSLGRKLKMPLEAQSPLGFAGNEEFYESDRFGLARSKTLKEYLPFTSRIPDPVYGETGGFRSSQSYYPDVDLSSVSIEPHYTSPPVVHGTAPWTHRKRSGSPGDFEHIEYGVPGTHSPVSTLSSGKYFPRIPGSYANLDTGVYQAYDPQFRAKSSISYIPSFDIIPPATGRERKAVYLEQWPGQ